MVGNDFRSAYSLLGAIFRECGWYFAALLLWSFVWSGFMIAIPYCLASIVSGLESDVGNATLFAVFYVVSQEGLNVAWRIWDLIEVHNRTRIMDVVSARGILLFVRRNIIFAESYEPSQIGKQLNDLSVSIGALLTVAAGVMPRSIGIVMATLVIVPISPFAAVAFFAWAIVFSIISTILSMRNTSLMAAASSVDAENAGSLAELVANREMALQYGKLTVETDRVLGARARYYSGYRAAARNNIWYQYLLGLSVSVLVAIVLALVLSQPSAKSEDIVFVLTVSTSLIWELWGIGTTVVGAAASMGVLKQALLELQLDYPDVNTMIRDEASELAPGELIRLSDVALMAPDGRALLSQVNWSVPERGALALIGPSGAGKTTLGRVIAGSIKPHAGTVTFRADTVIARVPQQPTLFNRSVRANLLYGSRGADPTDEELLKNTLLQFCGALPGGLDYDVGPSGNNLSGGQRQRIAIACALYSTPKVLVLDEATSALDPTTKNDVIDAIMSIGDVTTIWITHDQEVVRRVNQIARLDDGRLAWTDPSTKAK